MDDQIEHTLYINREVKVYRIPPRLGAGGHSSGTWRVDDCIFTGRMRVMAKGEAAEIRLEDAASGELFALCPFTPATQSVAIEASVDSSRYYVLRVEDPGTKRHAFLGIGFDDRGAAFDFNAALADHAKQCMQESIVAASAAHGSGGSSGSASPSGAGAAAAAAGGSSWQDPALASLYKDPGDLSLKDGQIIRIEVKRPHSGGGGFLARSQPAGGLGLRSPSGSGGGSIPPVLLPPPGQPQQPYSSLQPPPGTAAQQPVSSPAAAVGAAAAVTVASSEEGWATFD